MLQWHDFFCHFNTRKIVENIDLHQFTCCKYNQPETKSKTFPHPRIVTAVIYLFASSQLKNHANAQLLEFVARHALIYLKNKMIKSFEASTSKKKSIQKGCSDLYRALNASGHNDQDFFFWTLSSRGNDRNGNESPLWLLRLAIE